MKNNKSDSEFKIVCREYDKWTRRMVFAIIALVTLVFSSVLLGMFVSNADAYTYDYNQVQADIEDWCADNSAAENFDSCVDRQVDAFYFYQNGHSTGYNGAIDSAGASCWEEHYPHMLKINSCTRRNVVY